MCSLTHTLPLLDDSSQSICRKSDHGHNSKTYVLSTNDVIDFDANFFESCDIQDANELE